MQLRLNLAAGTDIRDGWINMDVVPQWPNTRRGCDIIWDARTDVLPFRDSTVDEIYAGYLLLHLAPRHHARVLADIRRVLKPSGKAVFGEVDMALVVQRFAKDPWDSRLAELIWGEQGDSHGDALSDFDKYCHGFTEVSLRTTLINAGFTVGPRMKVHTDAVWYELTLPAMPTGKPYITVTVPTVRVGGLDILFEALRTQTWRNFELVLVDGLYEQRKDLVRSHAVDCGFVVKHVPAIDNPFPVTAYCRYANTSLLWAEGEVVLHLTDYSAPDKNLLAKHAQHHVSHPKNTGLMGPHLYYALPALHKEFPCYRNEETQKYVEDIASRKLDPLMWSIFENAGPYSLQIDTTTNAMDLKMKMAAGSVHFNCFHAKNESCSLENLLDVNGWDEALDGGHGYQDMDIAQRLSLTGMVWEIDPSLVLPVVNPRPVFPYTVRNRSVGDNEKIYLESTKTGTVRANPAWDLRDLRAKCLAGLPFEMPWLPRAIVVPVEEIVTTPVESIEKAPEST